MYLDQAGLRIAAIGPPSVGPAFLVRSKMSGHVGHLRKCWTFLEMSDLSGHLGPRGLVQHYPMALKSYLELDKLRFRVI
jgi:hypothetical protein